MSNVIFVATVEQEAPGTELTLKMNLQTTAPNASLIASMIVDNMVRQLAQGKSADRTAYEQGYSAATLLMGIQQMALAGMLENLVKRQPLEFGQAASQGIHDAMAAKKDFWESFNAMVCPSAAKQ